MLTLFNKKKFQIRFLELEILNMEIRNKRKWRDLGMVFKQSLKCLKNDKIIFVEVILKLE